MSYRRFRKSRSWRNPRRRLSNEDKCGIAVSYITRANRMLGFVDVLWLKEKGVFEEVNNIRLQLSEIARKLTPLTLKVASEVKQ